MSADLSTLTGRLVSRRAVGRGTGAAVLVSTALLAAGCDSEGQLDLPGLPPLRKEEPDLEQVRTGLRDEQLLLGQVSRVRSRHQGLRRPLAATAAVHRAHVQLLSRAVGEADDPTPDNEDSSDSSDSGDSGDSAAGRGPARVPRDPAQAVVELIRLERSLAEQHVETAVRSRSGVLARVVAAMSAAAAQQAVTLAPLAATASRAER